MNDKTRVENIDCMIRMRETPDKFYELAIIDCPYGIGESSKKRENRTDRWNNPYKKQHNVKNWDDNTPQENYFNELLRISENQIIWGANHFISKIPFDSSCWVVWDKKNGESDFSDCELAWTSFDSGVRKFDWLWNGFQKQRPEERIHPTQKPVSLYKWLLKNYAKEGDKILDSHVGSGSSRIAAFDMGFEYIGYELDADYFNAQEKRFNQHKSQLKLFPVK